jgi:hypothetical protein
VSEADDPERVQAWVHPHLQYAGGEFDPQTARTGVGGPWKERVEATLDRFGGDAVAVVGVDEPHEPHRKFGFDEESVERAGVAARGDPDPRDVAPYVAGEYAFVPFGSDWDARVEDPDYGDVDPERIAGVVDGYDEVVVRGGFYGDCERTFVENLVVAADPDQRVVVDVANSYHRVGTSIGRTVDDPEERRVRYERKTGEARQTVAEVLDGEADHDDPAHARRIVEEISEDLAATGAELARLDGEDGEPAAPSGDGDRDAGVER